MTIVLGILFAISTITSGALILAHKGSGGVSGLFGTGVSTAAMASSQAEKNLTRMTVVSLVVWTVLVVLITVTV